MEKIRFEKHGSSVIAALVLLAVALTAICLPSVLAKYVITVSNTVNVYVGDNVGVEVEDCVLLIMNSLCEDDMSTTFDIYSYWHSSNDSRLKKSQSLDSTGGNYGAPVTAQITALMGLSEANFSFKMDNTYSNSTGVATMKIYFVAYNINNVTNYNQATVHHVFRYVYTSSDLTNWTLNEAQSAEGKCTLAKQTMQLANGQTMTYYTLKVSSYTAVDYTSETHDYIEY